MGQGAAYMQSDYFHLKKNADESEFIIPYRYLNCQNSLLN